MPHLQNPREERFAQLMALEDKKQGEAAREAGYPIARAHVAANELMRRERVRERIEELRKQAVTVAINATGISKAAIMQGLWQIATNKEEPAASRVRSYELCGKELKMFQERATVRFELPRNLTELNDDELEALKDLLLTLTYGDDEARKREAARRLEAEAGMVIEASAEPGPEW